MVAIVLVTSVVLIGIDQLLKLWVLQALAGNPSVMVIPGLLQLTYVENRGAAFGIFQGHVEILAVVTLAVLGALIYALGKKIFTHPLAVWSIGLIIAGGLGNLVDRIFRGFVVDYLDVSPLFSFPVFNFADCCVVIGTGLLFVYILLVDGKKKPSVQMADVPEPAPTGDIERDEQVPGEEQNG